MAVFRVKKSAGFTVMSNHHLRNKELSLKAKGLLSQMLSLPSDWDYTLKGLARINKEKIDAIRTAVLELEKAGYITRKQGRDELGKMAAIEYTIYEVPQPCLENPISEHPMSGNPRLENPNTDNPYTDNPHIENEYAVEKSIVQSYYGPADGAAHTITLSDLSESDVNTSIRYGESANKCNLTSAPNYTEAGYYPVYYEITYRYSSCCQG